jgi:hypothetical protein
MKKYLYKPKHLIRLNKKIDSYLDRQNIFIKILYFFKRKL